MPQVHRAPRGKVKHTEGSAGIVFTVKPPWDIAYSKRFRRYVAGHPGILKSVYILILNNMPELYNNKTVVEKGISISREATGSYKGSTGSLTLKVVIGNNSHFVKISKPIYSPGVQERIRRIKTLENFLARHSNKFEKLKLEIIKPSFFSNPVTKEQKYSFMVTPFYSKGEVIQVNDMPENHQKYNQIHNAIEWLQQSIQDSGVTKNISAKNAFYRARTNTLLLFDI